MLEQAGGYLAERMTGGSPRSMGTVAGADSLTKPVRDALYPLFYKLPDVIGALLMITLGIAMVITAVVLGGEMLFSDGQSRVRAQCDSEIESCARAEVEGVDMRLE